ncbi:unnamed protein product [Diatraea saccharalis]|uniref:Uncharacterized protein n=1 Tax=Diatraea saccharalis TaxID=40085 RepID=A0A9N9R6X4_9NEOP|nr:unnamed protein product [Diatraea saccharalis]
MFLPFLVVTATIQDNEARSQENHIPYKIIVENAKSRKNKEEIAKIIKYLNSYSKTEFEQNGDNTIEDADAEGLKLTDLMELAQKNYDTRVANDDLVAAPISSRVHVIKNPEVLKDYIEALRKGHSTSDSDDSSSDYDRIDNEYADIRRKAEPRYRNGILFLLKMLQKAYGESTLSKTRAYEWCKAFKSSRDVMEDLPRSGRPSTSATEVNIAKLKEKETENPKSTLSEIANELLYLTS